MDALDVHAGYGRVSTQMFKFVGSYLSVAVRTVSSWKVIESWNVSFRDFPNFQATPRLFGQAGSDPPWQLHPSLHEALKEAQRGAP